MIMKHIYENISTGENKLGFFSSPRNSRIGIGSMGDLQDPTDGATLALL